MRNIALTFLGCFTILAACSNSDDAEKPVTPVATGDVTIYATTSSLTRDLTRDAVNFSSKDNLAPTSITLNPTEQYQTMDGFGAAITGATCFNRSILPAEGQFVPILSHFRSLDIRFHLLRKVSCHTILVHGLTFHPVLFSLFIH